MEFNSPPPLCKGEGLRRRLLGMAGRWGLASVLGGLGGGLGGVLTTGPVAMAAPTRASRPAWMSEPLYAALLEDLRSQAQMPSARAEALLAGVKLQARALRLAFPPPKIEPPGSPPTIPPSLSELALRQTLPDILAQGSSFVRSHSAAIDEVSAQFEVPPAVLLGILGVETRFGRIQGTFPTLDTLATLGFKGQRRQDFFLQELVALVRLSDALGRPVGSFAGSFAGALGIPQFMPSSYLRWARSHARVDRPADLFQRPEDALASVGNFLREHGWSAAHPVALPCRSTDPDLDRWEVVGLQAQHTLGELIEAGAVAPRDAEGYSRRAPMSLIRLTEGTEPDTRWAVGPSFFAITHYNRSYRYAASVLALAGGLRGSLGISGPRWAGSRSVPLPLQG